MTKGTKLKKETNTRYPAAFRAQVIHKARMCGSARTAGKKFGVPQSTVYYWTSRAQELELKAERERMRLEQFARAEMAAGEEGEGLEPLAREDLEAARTRLHHGLLMNLAGGRYSVRDKLRAFKILSDDLHKLPRDSGRGQLDAIADALQCNDCKRREPRDDDLPQEL